MENNNVIWHDGYVKRQEKNHLNRHKSGVVWFTGLSASGKSTIAHYVDLVIETDKTDIKNSIRKVMELFDKKRFLSAD